MVLEQTLFFLLALLAVVGGALMVRVRDPRIAKRGRVAFLLSLAPLYAQLGAPDLGLVQMVLAVAVGWKSLGDETETSSSKASWLASAGLAATGLLSARLWWMTYQDFPRRAPRGAVATVWDRPLDLLEPLSLSLVLLALTIAVAWGIRQPGGSR